MALVKQKKLQDSVLISSFEIDILVQIASRENPPAIALISKTPANTRMVEICTRLKTFSWPAPNTIPGTDN